MSWFTFQLDLENTRYTPKVKYLVNDAFCSFSSQGAGAYVERRLCLCWMPQTREQPLNGISSGFEPDMEFPATSMAHPPEVLTCVCKGSRYQSYRGTSRLPKGNLMCQEWNDLVFAHGGRCNQRRGNSSFSARFPLSYTASDASWPSTTLTWRIPRGLHR